jgi:hypothetical protein
MLGTPSTTLKARNLPFILFHLVFSTRERSVSLAMERLSMFQAYLEKLMVLNRMESVVMEGYWSLTGHIFSLTCIRL